MGTYRPLVLTPKDLPKVSTIHIWPRNSRGYVVVSIGLERGTRAGLQRWAERLGIDIVENAPLQSPAGSGTWCQRLDAVHQADGVETRVWVILAVAAPAEGPTVSENSAQADR